ncbi:hypothetical protein LCGC14_0739420 [marine sediment metagenome]|uniref:Uncharacterized protein n=1 Tax=marine sediment metagenome TaxID=412755 RepID=A0A0F9Q763_9ZZZZ
MKKIVIISVILLGLFYVEYSSRQHDYYTNGPENGVYEEPDKWLAVNGDLPTITFGEDVDTGIWYSEPSLVFESVSMGFYETVDEYYAIVVEGQELLRITKW